MSKKKIKNEWLDRNVFILPLYYTLCLTKKQFRDSLKHFKIRGPKSYSFQADSGSDATCHFFKNKLGKEAAIVCLTVGENNTGVEISGLLLHEAIHIWQTCMKMIGERKPSSEFEAYGIQCIAQSLMQEYERQKK